MSRLKRDVKEDSAEKLRETGFDVMDFGAHCLVQDDDYLDMIVRLARAVAEGDRKT